ncbi:MAG: LysR substrate-binding domain-containing protein [Brevundimonas sp.]
MNVFICQCQIGEHRQPLHTPARPACRLSGRISRHRRENSRWAGDECRDRRAGGARRSRLDHTSLPDVDLAYQELQEDIFGAVHANDRQNFDVIDTWTDLAQVPFIAMALRSSVRQATDQAFLQAGVFVRCLYECGHLATVGALVGRGLGVTAPSATDPAAPARARFLMDPLRCGDN